MWILAICEFAKGIAAWYNNTAEYPKLFYRVIGLQQELGLGQVLSLYSGVR